MKRMRTHNRGFTLIEIVLVIAIIVILASVLFISVSSYLNQAKAAENIVNSNISSHSAANSNINSKFIDLGY